MRAGGRFSLILRCRDMMIADVWEAVCFNSAEPTARSGGHDKEGDRQRVPPLQPAEHAGEQ